MKKFSYLLSLLLFVSLAAMGKSRDLKVLQMNIWQEGTQVKGGFEAIADEIVRTDADIVMFSEIRNYNGKKFLPRILKALEDRGVAYNGKHNDKGDANVISKHKIVELQPIESAGNSLARASVEVDGKIVAVYACHLDYTHDATFLPRGYDGNSWRKLDAPVTDIAEIQKMSLASTRGEGIRAVIADAENEIKKGHIVIVGGDFNEASHLDWNEKTKDMFDHHGTVVPWECSNELANKGYKDAYRVVYPDPVTHPAFTFPSDNKGVEVRRLAWAPASDERCRLDYVYYMPHKKLKVKDAIIVGPDSSILCGKRVKETSEDKFITPLGAWPSDHKAMLVVFKLKK